MYLSLSYLLAPRSISIAYESYKEEIDSGEYDINKIQPSITGTCVKLSVIDNGAGIDGKNISRIFDPFYTTKTVGQGTGMGLSVVHGIVESFGGYISVESELGRGSTFNVFLPVVEEDAENFEVETTALFRTGTERIFIVDDEESILRVSKRILEKLGYKVTIESDSVKALEIFKSNQDQFDLIITDQSMPNMSGSEFVAEISKIRPDIPVILCTGYSTKVSAENAKEKGISKYINKPFDKKLLSDTVREVLDVKI